MHSDHRHDTWAGPSPEPDVTRDVVPGGVSFADKIRDGAASAWDPRQVWLDRVRKPREARVSAVAWPWHR